MINNIYVANLSNVSSGGPELMHQLCYHLRHDFGYQSYMYFVPDQNCSLPSDYVRYGNPVAFEIKDEPGNLLIVPEHYLCLKILSKYRHVKKFVWFLSIDNYYLSRLKISDFFIKRLINKIMSLFRINFVLNIDNCDSIIHKYKISNDMDLLSADLIATNSHRGLYFLKNNGFNSKYLSEYLHEDFFALNQFMSSKKNIVAYNPKKGLSFTKKIIRQAHDLTFVPVSDMTRYEVVALLSFSKVYIDFGNHPGKDRLPREAAILGCCVLTGKRGSAAFAEDVPIKEDYKFEDLEQNVEHIISKINYCFNNFEEAYSDFDDYRNYILQEKVNFVKDLAYLMKFIDKR